MQWEGRTSMTEYLIIIGASSTKENGRFPSIVVFLSAAAWSVTNTCCRGGIVRQHPRGRDGQYAR